MRPTDTEAGSGVADGGLIADQPLSMVITDPRLPGAPIVYVNRAFEEVTGYAARYAVGRNCRFLQGDDTDQPALDVLRAALWAGEPCVVDLRNYRADGSPFLNRLMTAPLRDPDGAVVAFVGVQCEVPERTAPDRIAAAEATGMLRRALDGVHDNLERVASIVDVQAGTEDAMDAYRALAGRVEALSLLHDEFSRPARMPGGNGAVVAAGGYIGRVAATVGALEGTTGIRLNVDADTVPMRRRDAAKLGMIASEALSNTFRHAFADRDEGLVEVRLKALTGDRLRLTVADDGVGMGDASWPREGALGARIVRSVVAQLDGRLDVSSRGHGTTVTLDFRYAPPEARPA